MLRRIAVVIALGVLAAGPAATQFFPPRAFSDRPDLDGRTAAWYSRHLTAMEESSLLKAKERKNAEIYRFIWLRTFHPSFVFRLEVRADGTGTLVAKNTDGKGGYDPGRLTLSKTLTLDAKRVRQFTSALGTLKFWDLPATDPSRSGHDGAQWILEGVKGGRYHVIDRWSPEDGSFRKLMLDLVSLSGVRVNPIY
jgi:hypothetical protein